VTAILLDRQEAYLTEGPGGGPASLPKQKSGGKKQERRGSWYIKKEVSERVRRSAKTKAEVQRSSTRA